MWKLDRNLRREAITSACSRLPATLTVTCPICNASVPVFYCSAASSFNILYAKFPLVRAVESTCSPRWRSSLARSIEVDHVGALLSERALAWVVGRFLHGCAAHGERAHEALKQST